jgi:hypothetical protein
MKKLTLILAALVLLSSGAFAVEAALSASIEGDATMTFGVNLETGATGITNASSANLKITFVPKASEESEAVDGVYGWIKLKDFQWTPNANDGADKDFKAPGVEAKIIIGPAFINILGASNNVNYASLGMGRTTVDKDDDPFTDTLKINTPIVAGNPGVSVGADLGVIKFEVGASSALNWSTTADSTTREVVILTAAPTAATGVRYFAIGYVNAVNGGGAEAGEEITNFTGAVYPLAVVKETITAGRAANVNNDYNFWGMVGLTAVENLTLDVKVNYAMSTETLGLGVRAGYKLMLDEMFLQPMVGFDFNAKDPSEWELGAGVQFSFGGADIKRNFFGAADGYNEDQTIRNGVGVGFHMSSDEDIDPTLQFTFFDGALIPVVDVTAIATLNLADDLVLALGARVSADLGVVVPFTEFFHSAAGDVKSMTYLAVGTDVKVIPNVVFTLRYSNDTLHQDAVEGGILTLATKISF